MSHRNADLILARRKLARAAIRQLPRSVEQSRFDVRRYP